MPPDWQAQLTALIPRQVGAQDNSRLLVHTYPIGLRPHTPTRTLMWHQAGAPAVVPATPSLAACTRLPALVSPCGLFQKGIPGFSRT